MDLINQFPKIKFHIFGDGSGKERLREEMLKSHNDFVELHGKVSDAEIAYFRRKSKFYYLSVRAGFL
jgi:glycosyltransferase involved in cell wall biosynthesis